MKFKKRCFHICLGAGTCSCNMDIGFCDENSTRHGVFAPLGFFRICFTTLAHTTTYNTKCCEHVVR